MKATHRLTIKAKCPVNKQRDTYALTVVTRRTLPILKVEDILQVVKEETEEPVFQEALTESLALRLNATVRTVGKHSGVETTVVCKG